MMPAQSSIADINRPTIPGLSSARQSRLVKPIRTGQACGVRSIATSNVAIGTWYDNAVVSFPLAGEREGGVVITFSDLPFPKAGGRAAQERKKKATLFPRSDPALYPHCGYKGRLIERFDQELGSRCFPLRVSFELFHFLTLHFQRRLRSRQRTKGERNLRGVQSPQGGGVHCGITQITSAEM